MLATVTTIKVDNHTIRLGINTTKEDRFNTITALLSDGSIGTIDLEVWCYG